jgi:hypothetical protein
VNIQDSILWNSGPTQEIYQNPRVLLDIRYSDIRGGASGFSLQNEDPLFADEDAGNARLLPNSPAADAGSHLAEELGLDSSLQFGTSADLLTGDTGQVDLGFHYSGYSNPPPPVE